MSLDLDGRVALVTGGAGGIGSELCRRLAAAGAHVVLADLPSSEGGTLAAALGGTFAGTDVRSLESLREAVDTAERTWGGLDLVVLNAGISTGCGLGEDFDAELYQRAVAVNLDGVALGVVAALPALRRRGGGTIVATASLAGITPLAFDPVYTATKHGVVGLVRALGPAVASEGIRVLALCPAFAETPILGPMRDALVGAGVRLLTAGEVGDAAMRALDEGQPGECWFVQPGVEPAAYRFRGVPGPR